MRRRFTTGAAVFMALGIVLAACGGDSSSKTTAAGSTAASTTTTAAMPASSAMMPTSSAMMPAGATLKLTSSAKGMIVTDGAGVALYIFTMDKPDMSVCDANAQCAGAWPPYEITGMPQTDSTITGKVGTITTPDGKTQVTINQQPLYYFKNDAMKPNSITGQGVGNVWYLVGADGKQIM